MTFCFENHTKIVDFNISLEYNWIFNYQRTMHVPYHCPLSFELCDDIKEG